MEQERKRYPSDLTEAEWAILEPLVPQAKPSGHPPHCEHSGGGERHLLRAPGWHPLALPLQGLSSLADRVLLLLGLA